MPHCPLISVALPVYNGAEYLRAALESILCQTYGNFELIIIDDGSQDGSAAIIGEFSDPRIRFHKQENAGLSATLNRCIGLAQGKYLARQDQDDLALPERFARQVAYLEDHPACGMVGSWAAIIEGERRTDRALRHPGDNSLLQFELLFDNPFVHSSMMIRREVFDSVGLYCTDRSRQPPEDYELWSRVARRWQVANLPEILEIYREVPTSMSRTGINPFLTRLMLINRENIAHLSGRDQSDPVVVDLVQLVHDHGAPCSSTFSQIRLLVEELAGRLAALPDAEPALLERRAAALLETIRSRHVARRYGRVAGALFRVGGRALRRVGLP